MSEVVAQVPLGPRLRMASTQQLSPRSSHQWVLARHMPHDLRQHTSPAAFVTPHAHHGRRVSSLYSVSPPDSVCTWLGLGLGLGLGLVLVLVLGLGLGLGLGSGSGLGLGLG